ncbi:N utilization substance protein B [Caldicoprobacter guelmensis]|uniref:transcription antitermination factor NusB n=1 Tax=Caldicoprobacter guelmensis TaxID=1170224 RepID=UPI00195CF25E|nr:transcription antitermination factor NusB [Caldicoprobacter guelmensis]MBM7581293.1 N utilization substance protein B [Caldicoprobacter guelmensis]
MARKDAREVAMKLLYQKDFSGETDLDYLLIMDPHYSINEKDREYILDMLNLFESHAQEIDGYIKDFSIGWEFSRIAKVDLAILRLALCEMLYRSDIPVSVSINEAVELAKKFSGDKSGKFVNGVLGGFIRSRQIEKEGQSSAVEGQASFEGEDKQQVQNPSGEQAAAEAQDVSGDKGDKSGAEESAR